MFADSEQHERVVVNEPPGSVGSRRVILDKDGHINNYRSRSREALKKVSGTLRHQVVEKFSDAFKVPDTFFNTLLSRVPTLIHNFLRQFCQHCGRIRSGGQ